LRPRQEIALVVLLETSDAQNIVLALRAVVRVSPCEESTNQFRSFVRGRRRAVADVGGPHLRSGFLGFLVFLPRPVVARRRLSKRRGCVGYGVPPKTLKRFAAVVGRLLNRVFRVETDLGGVRPHHEHAFVVTHQRRRRFRRFEFATCRRHVHIKTLGRECTFALIAVPFRITVRAGVALRAVAFQLPVRAGCMFALIAVPFQLPMRAGVAVHTPVFQLAVRARGALRALIFQLAVRAAVAHRPRAFQPAVRAALALHAVVFQFAVGARVAFPAVAFHLPMRTRGAHRAVSFQLVM
jgi:hypothetical protein